MLGWHLCSDAISARSDEPQGGLTKPGRDGTCLRGTCMVQPRDARKIPLTPPRELCQSTRVEVRKKTEESRATLEGWRAGNQKRARPWLSAEGSAQTCLTEPYVRALPPMGAAGRIGR